MRKEKLLDRKQNVIENMVWYAKMVITDDDLKKFSISQLKLLCEIIQRAEDNRENRSPFYSISACEVIQKSSGKIAYFENSGEIHEETEDEVMNGASSQIYKNYKMKNG